ncbi:MAG TPA: helix-turn-helix transcriptional regulator [Rhizomicrobium sp.]|jgi:transcriptional regulator with XRE-family HTH domain|nr:helix-turn-helix transcriptional regulator [Rhizomicrobium sp.]
MTLATDALTFTFALRNQLEKQMAGRGKANSVDRRVGNRLRIRRTALGLSQEELGRQLGLTFQQVQKFESGTNRISSSYLFELTRILRVPVSYFFEGADHPEKNEVPERMQRFLMSAEGLTLWRSFAKLKDDTVRARVIALVKAMAEESNHSRKH